VSQVKDMAGMFSGATSFNQQLCGFAWVHSKARQQYMFQDSSGSICLPSAINISTNPAASLPTTTVMAEPVTQSYLKNLDFVTAIIVSVNAVLILIVAVVVIMIRLRKTPVVDIPANPAISLVDQAPRVDPNSSEI